MVALLAGAAPADAAPPRVQTMVVERGGGIAAAGPLRAPAVRIRGCRVRAGTALAALAAVRRAGGPSFRATGGCGSLYVDRIGRQGETRLGGWVYKVGRALPSVGAEQRRVRRGQRVTWFFCERAGRCQRTLEVRPEARAVAAGTDLAVRVTAYDDRGRGRPAAGATVAFGDATATTNAQGRAVVRAPAEAGRQALTARGRGVVPAHPTEIVVG